MAQLKLSKKEREAVYWDTAVCALGLSPEEAEQTVRFPYGGNASSVPALERGEMACFIFLIPLEEDYGKLRNISHRDDGEDGRLTRIDEHTDIYQANFSCYGPDAFEWAQTLKNGLYQDEVRRILREKHIAMVSDSPNLTYMPELINGEWWERCDLVATFYELVRLEQDSGVIEQVQLKSVSERGM